MQQNRMLSSTSAETPEIRTMDTPKVAIKATSVRPPTGFGQDRRCVRRTKEVNLVVTKSKDRFLEIQFSQLCMHLHDAIRNYIMITNYVEILADIANVERNSALRLMQKAFQDPVFKFTRTEFICVAKQNGYTINEITKALKISKTTYLDLIHSADLDLEYPNRCSTNELNTIKALLNAHKTIKELV